MLVAGGNGDHEPLLAMIPCAMLGYTAPPPQVPVPRRRERKFCLPMQKDQLRRVYTAFTANCRGEIRQFEQAAADAVTRLEQAHYAAAAESTEPQAYRQAFTRHKEEVGVAADVVEDLASQVNRLLSQALDEAHKQCDMYEPTDKHYRKRGTARRVATLDARTCLLKVGWQAVQRQHPAGKDGEELLAAMKAEMLVAVGANRGEGAVGEGLKDSNPAQEQEAAAGRPPSNRQSTHAVRMLARVTHQDVAAVLQELRESLCSEAGPGQPVADEPLGDDLQGRAHQDMGCRQRRPASQRARRTNVRLEELTNTGARPQPTWQAKAPSLSIPQPLRGCKPLSTRASLRTGGSGGRCCALTTLRHGGER